MARWVFPVLVGPKIAVTLEAIGAAAPMRIRWRLGGNFIVCKSTERGLLVDDKQAKRAVHGNILRCPEGKFRFGCACRAQQTPVNAGPDGSLVDLVSESYESDVRRRCWTVSLESSRKAFQHWHTDQRAEGANVGSCSVAPMKRRRATSCDMTYTVVLIPGDGIGPEVSRAVRHIFKEASAPVRFVEHLAGEAALADGATELLPQSTLDAIRKHHVALKGPCTTPVGSGFRSVNVALRKTLKLYAAVRPVRSLEGVETRYDDVDLVIVRENTEGLYSGVENAITDGVVASMKVATRVGCQRIAHWAFRFATHRKRQKITCFHKANIMKMTDGMFIEEARKVHQEDYPNIEYKEMIVDAASMRLVQDPSQFDILLCENLYGDIVSDLAAGLVGGLGVTPGANFGDNEAIFEAVHGSAPDIAGQDLANPLALLMSGTMMLNHLAVVHGDDNCSRVADKIDAAYLSALKAGEKTRDLGGELGTSAFAQAVVDRLA